MVVHAVGHETLGIVDVSGGLPGIVGKLDFMARGAKLRSGGANHGVISDAEKGKRHENADDNVNGRLYQFFPKGF